MRNSELLTMIMDFTNVFNEFNNKAFKFIDEQLSKTGLVRTHFIILHELVGGKELSMSDLSEILHVTKPNITVLIDKLVKLDYVERVNKSQDRRVILIRLTGKGEAFIGKSSEELIESVVQLLDYLDQEDLYLVKQSTQVMKVLIAKLNKK
ncbi:MarR family transcriptional regulator [Anoxybacterium hadale]|uniref:MarR family transcriptional regulator n=1 Tax=Anoxybacterium hadale TaxID=3408580 RepID=A0ACD1AGV3_9FIRM|nr:MarR family transcriptional regulator [Clostridiales bacterium]